MDSLQFPNKNKAAKVGILVAIFVGVVLISYAAVAINFDLLEEEQIRTELIAEISKSPEICDQFTTIEECVDNLMKVISES